MSDHIRAFCDYSELIQSGGYINTSGMAALLPKQNEPGFPGSAFARVSLTVNNLADAARAASLASGAVGYEMVEEMIGQLLRPCLATVALHVGNARERVMRREPFSLFPPELAVPVDDAPADECRAYQRELERRTKASGELARQIASARCRLKTFAKALAASAKLVHAGNGGVLPARVYSAPEVALPEIANAPLSRPVAPASSTRTNRKPKRSTERGEGRAKLIAALTQHHRYAHGGSLNTEPVGNNELAKVADVSTSTASAFFNSKFKGHAKYRAACRDVVLLAGALKILNGEFAAHILYGRRPTDEDYPNDRK